MKILHIPFITKHLTLSSTRCARRELRRNRSYYNNEPKEKQCKKLRNKRQKTNKKANEAKGELPSKR